MPGTPDQTHFIDAFDSFDTGAMDFFDFGDLTDYTNVGKASNNTHDLSGPSQSSTTVVPLQHQPLNPLCSCQSLIFDLYRRVIAAESFISNLQSLNADNNVTRRLSKLESRLEKMEKVQGSMEVEIHRHHNWIKHYDDQVDDEVDAE